MHQADLDHARWISQFDELGEQTDGIGSILRWLWTTNLAAAIAGIIMHHYLCAVIAGVSSIVSLLGAAASRRTKKTVENAIKRYRNRMT
jgi:hypothetical protein